MWVPRGPRLFPVSVDPVGAPLFALFAKGGYPNCGW
jgi:hypothetical protein